MIKKILLGLGITFLSFIGFSNAYMDYVIELPGTFYVSSVSNYVTRSLNFQSDSGFYLKFTDYAGSDSYSYYFWNNNKLYLYTKTYQGLSQGYIEKMCKTDTNSTCSSPMTTSALNDFYNSEGGFNIFKYNLAGSVGFCADNGVNTYCFNPLEGNTWGAYLTGTLNIPEGTINFNNYAQNSPFVKGSSSVVGIAPGSIDSALNYYEKHYGWDSSICYAGVDSLNYLYGQNGVSYTPGSGLSIFQVYEGLYGNKNNKEDFLLYTSRWLNSWLINYHERFDTSGNPSWLAYYNSGTHLVDYQFDNLGFPFANQPVAFYFLTDNIQGQTEQITQGEEVVSYCNIKINSGTYDEIIGSANKYNINSYTEQGNTNVGLNPDGTKHEYTGAFLGSGVNLAFSGNVSIKNTLKNFFDELNKSINIVGNASTTSILPNWLVVAFLTVILFKFLRKRN